MIKKRTPKNVSLRNKTETPSSAMPTEEVSTTSTEPMASSTISETNPLEPTSSGDENNHDEDINLTLEKTKLKQKLRSRPKGMQANLKTGDLFDLEKIKSSSAKRKKEKMNILQGGTQGGLIDRTSGDWIAMKLANTDKSNTSSSSLSQLAMDANFTEAELSEQDKRLFEYIREKMKEKGYSYDDHVNITNDDDVDNEKKGLPSDITVKEILEKEKDLYRLPEELKVDKLEIPTGTKKQQSDNKPLTEEERQKLLSGAILEVPLSISSKVQNIRETNEAVKEMQENEDHNPHKRRYNTSSDDYVFTQFKKKHAHKR